MFTVLHPLMLVAAATWVTCFKKKDEGRIRLPDDQEGGENGPREVNDWN